MAKTKKKESPYPIYDQNLRFSLSYYQKFYTRADTIALDSLWAPAFEDGR